MKYKFIIVSLLIAITSCAQAMLTDQKGNPCNMNRQYIVVEKSLAPNVGNDILVWQFNPKITSPTALCRQQAQPYLTIPGANKALSFSGLQGNYLLLDDGTGPDLRDLYVYDLKNKKQIFHSDYYQPASLRGNFLIYWVNQPKANLKVCPDYQKNQQNGLGTVVIEKVILNLAVLKSQRTGTTRCITTQ